MSRIDRSDHPNGYTMTPRECLEKDLAGLIARGSVDAYEMNDTPPKRQSELPFWQISQEKHGNADKILGVSIEHGALILKFEHAEKKLNPDTDPKRISIFVIPRS